jgi:FlaA1/EpsC-like NDP-sugar epimerase
MMRRRIRSVALPLHRHSLPQLAVDGALVALAYYMAFQLRFDNGPHGPYVYLRERTIWWVAIGGVVVLVLSRVYLRSWRYSGQRDYEAVLRGVAITTLLLVVAVAVVRPVQIPSHHRTVAVGLPNGVVAMFFLLALVALVGVRVLVRTVYERRPLAALGGVREGERSVLIVGAGDGGRLVLREIARNRELGLAPVGFLDDDPRKRGLRIDGVRVRGDTQRDLPRILEEAEPDEVVIAIPSAPGSMRARVVRECRKRSIPVRTLPTVFELLQGGGGVVYNQVREVQVEDVLGREPVHMELDRVGAYLAGETVLVTGAGGSIGSELCRQIARVLGSPPTASTAGAPAAGRPAGEGPLGGGPKGGGSLILLDHAEDNLFEIQRELLEDRHVQPAALVAVLADCKEEERMREIFSEFRPTVVFHAAAYKHVGLMEANPVEAVRNNAIATRVVAHVAGEAGVGRFVLVSTDKAVAPATVMGASKALAEFALEAATARWTQTRYKAVRFGNVLGSSGSVVPIFRRQIARGGPVTVTDERMTRYFMTIPEAVQLIIRAGSLDATGIPATSASLDATSPADANGSLKAAGSVEANGSLASTAAVEVFVLDMGEPVRIVELARAMIELSGLDPERDIDIEIVGRRPGEKLHEELFNDYERRCATAAEKILLAERSPLGVKTVEAMFEEINLLVLEGDAAGLAAKVAELSSVREAPSSVREASHESVPPATGDSAPVPLIHSQSS